MMRTLLFTFACLLLAAQLKAQESPPKGPERWEREIAAIEARDQKTPPPRGGIVFVGSSSIRLWPLEKSFPDLPVVNHGFGGSVIADSTHFAGRLVAPLAPRTVVLYAGDNDLAQGRTPEQVAEDFRLFVGKTRESLPEARILFIAIKPSIARWKLIESVRRANALVAKQCADDERLEFVDIQPLMLGDDGQPRRELFRDDGLHLNDQGYTAWTEKLRPAITQ